MNCEHAEQSILLQDSGELGAWGRLRLARHLAGCAACRAYRSDLRATRTALQALPAPTLDSRDRAVILDAAMPDRRDTIRLSPRHQPVSWWRPALAAAVLAALLGVHLYLRPDAGPTPVQVARQTPPPDDITTLDEAVDAELDALQQLLVASWEEPAAPTDAEAMDEETLARELLALQEL